MEMYGINPYRMRDLAKASDSVTEIIEWQGDAIEKAIATYELEDFSSNAAALCKEVSDELSDLALIARSKADQIEGVANSGPENPAIAQAADRLEASLGDDLGKKAIEDPAAAAKRREELETWLKENPDFDQHELEMRMEDAAAAGDKEALTFLSNALWERVENMDEDDATDFLMGLEPVALVLATELVDPPEIQAVYTVMTIRASPLVPPDAGMWEMGEFLWQRMGVNPDRYDEYFSDKMEELAAGNDDVASLIFNAVDKIGDGDFNNFENSPYLAEAVRNIVRTHKETFANHLEWNGRGQNIIDLMVVGADADDEEGKRIRADLAAFQGAFAAFCDDNPPEGVTLRTFGRYYRFMQASGHEIAYDYTQIGNWVEAAGSVANTWTFGIPGAVIALSDADVPDNIPASRNEADVVKLDQYNAAYAVLQGRDPILTSRIAKAFDTDKSGQITEQMLVDLKETDPELWSELEDVRLEMEMGWVDGDR